MASHAGTGQLRSQADPENPDIFQQKVNESYHTTESFVFRAVS